MDSMEVNKIIAAMLVSGIAFFLAALIASGLVHPVHLQKSAIVIEGTAAPTTAAATPDKPIGEMLATADPAKGKSLTSAAGCVACHTFTEGGKAGVGPNLYGVVGAEHGHMAGFAYSAALKGKTGPWTFDELNEWLKKPSAYAPGTKMSFAGLPDEAKRAAIIDYLRTLAATPEPLPAAAAPAPAPAAPAAK